MKISIQQWPIFLLVHVYMKSLKTNKNIIWLKDVAN